MAIDYNLGLDSQNPFLQQGNPYLDQIIGQVNRDTVDNYNRTVLPASNAAMLRSGSFGNSGLQQMQDAADQRLQQTVSDQSAKLRYNDYNDVRNLYMGQQAFDEGKSQFDQNFGRATFNDAYAQNMGNLQAGLGLVDWLGNRTNTDLTNATTQQNAPLSYLQQFSQIASGLGGMGQTSTGTQGTSSNPLLSAAGGAQLGNSFANWWGTQGGYQSAPASASTVGYSTSPAWDAWAGGTSGMGG